MTRFLPSLSLFLIVSLFVSQTATAQLAIAQGAVVKFSGKKVEGTFTSINGDINFDPNNLGSANFRVIVKVASIHTGNKKKDEHALGENWFDQVKFPFITFTSLAITKTDKGYQAIGTLDLHGVQKEVTLPFTFENNTFNGSLMVKRLDYNLGPTKGMGAKAALDLEVNITVPVAT